MELAIVGLGKMGMNMSTRLVRGGHRVVGYARTAATVDEAIRLGAEGAHTLEVRRSRLDHIEHVGDRLQLIEPGVASVETLERAVQPGKDNLIECDLMDAFSVHKLVGAVKPDRIFHLAAQSHVPASWNAPTC